MNTSPIKLAFACACLLALAACVQATPTPPPTSTPKPSATATVVVEPTVTTAPPLITAKPKEQGPILSGPPTHFPKPTSTPTSAIVRIEHWFITGVKIDVEFSCHVLGEPDAISPVWESNKFIAGLDSGCQNIFVQADTGEIFVQPMPTAVRDFSNPDAVFSPNRKYFFDCDDLGLYQASNNQLLSHVNIRLADYCKPSWNPDSTAIAIVAEDGLYIWRIDSAVV